MRVTSVKQFISTVRQPPIVNDKAFKFLMSCDNAKIDWTVAQPLLLHTPPYLNNKQLKLENLMPYRSVGGSKLLINSATEYFLRQGINCNRENIVIGSGVFHIFDNVCRLLQIKDREQKILMMTPTFGSFYTHCQHSELSTDFLETTIENNWEIEQKALDRTLSNNPNTKVLLLNYPNNPTGKVMGERYAYSIAEVLLSYPDVLIISDEILQDIFLKEDLKPFSIASLPQMRDRTIVINSPAKSRALASSQVAFAYLPDEMAKGYREMRDLNVAPTYIQGIVAESLMDSQENRNYLEKNSVDYNQNISNIIKQLDLLNQQLNQHFQEDGIAYVKPYIERPEAGNVYLLDFSGLQEKLLVGSRKLENGLDIAKLLLEKADIGVVPGECFLLPPETMTVRIPLSTPQKEIAMGFEKIGQAIIENLKNPPKFPIKQLSGECQRMK